MSDDPNVLIDFKSLEGYLVREDAENPLYHDIGFIMDLGYQSSEVNDLVQIMKRRTKSVSDALLKDGAIIKNGGASFQQGMVAGTIGKAQVYSEGYAVDVPAETFIGLPAEGAYAIGVLVSKKVVTAKEDPTLKDPAKGTTNYNNPGAARLKVWGQWVRSDSITLLAPGQKFYPIYQIADAILISPDVKDPQMWSVTEKLADYDRAANGSYVSVGNNVVYSRDVTDNAGNKFHEFMVTPGTANIDGYQYSWSSPRFVRLPEVSGYSLSNTEPVVFQTARKQRVRISFTQSGTPQKCVNYVRIGPKEYSYTSTNTPTAHEVMQALYNLILADPTAPCVPTFDGTFLTLESPGVEAFQTPVVSGYLNYTNQQSAVSNFYQMRFMNVKRIIQIVGQKKVVEETVTHGAAQGSRDLLSKRPVTAILEVRQVFNGKLFKKDIDYALVGDTVDWSIGGDQPAGGSQYLVTYLYQDIYIPGDTDQAVLVSDDHKKIRLEGWADQTSCQVTYEYWLMRCDRILIDRDATLYPIPGESYYVNPVAKPRPIKSLSLANVTLSKFGAPVIETNYFKAYTMKEVEEIQP